MADQAVKGTQESRHLVTPLARSGPSNRSTWKAA
jgi:hypothetical protein